MRKCGAQILGKSVCRSFAEAGLVVDQVDLKIEPGEFVALLGPSGCGKSTLLRMIAGLDQPDAGSLEVNAFGENYFRSFVFQEATLLPWQTVLKNVLMPLELTGFAPEIARARAREELARVGLAQSETMYPFQLSGGMKMRVSLARALTTHPTLLLLDEPLAALDEYARHALQDELRRIWESLKMTVLFVTHSVSEAVFLANRVIVFSKRPTHIAAEHRIELPETRTPQTRLSADYMREIKKIYDSVPIAEAPL